MRHVHVLGSGAKKLGQVHFGSKKGTYSSKTKMRSKVVLSKLDCKY